MASCISTPKVIKLARELSRSTFRDVWENARSSVPVFGRRARPQGMTFLAAPTAGRPLAVSYFARFAVVSQLLQFLFDGSALLEQERDGLLA